MAALRGSVQKNASDNRLTGYLITAAVLLAVISMVLACGVSDGAYSNVSVYAESPEDSSLPDSSSRVFGDGPGVLVDDIELDKKTLSLAVNETQTLKVRFDPITATDQALYWGSMDKKVAVVDDNGNVTGVGVGTVIIKVTAHDTAKGEHSDTCEVTVTDVRVSSITLDISMADMHPRETLQLTPIIMPENASDKEVTWKSDKPSVATVDANGKVTALSAGSVKITATTHDGGKSASCTINITNVPVESVTLDKMAASVEKDESITLRATVLPANASIRTITWSSSDSSVASVDSSGKVTGHKLGTAIITVRTTDGGKTNSCSVTVLNSNPVEVEVNAATKVVNNIVLLTDPVAVTNSIKSIIEDEGNSPILIVKGNSRVVMLEKSVVDALSTSSTGALRLMVPDVTIVIKSSALSQIKFSTDKVEFNMAKVDPPKGYNFKMMASYNMFIGDGQRYYTLSGFGDSLVMAVSYVPGESEDTRGLGVGYVTASGITSLTTVTYSGNVIQYDVPMTAQYVIYNSTIPSGEFNVWAGIAFLVVALIAVIVIVMRFLFRVE